MSSALLPARSYLVTSLMGTRHPVRQRREHLVPQSRLCRREISEHKLNHPR
jgi:hypothetical protein